MYVKILTEVAFILLLIYICGINSFGKIGSGFICNGFFLSDSNLKLADRKYPLN